MEYKIRYKNRTRHKRPRRVQSIQIKRIGRIERNPDAVRCTRRIFVFLYFCFGYPSSIYTKIYVFFIGAHLPVCLNWAFPTAISLAPGKQLFRLRKTWISLAIRWDNSSRLYGSIVHPGNSQLGPWINTVCRQAKQSNWVAKYCAGIPDHPHHEYLFISFLDARDLKTLIKQSKVHPLFESAEIDNCAGLRESRNNGSSSFTK